jgi:DNA repair protein RecO (recombination protein O)
VRLHTFSSEAIILSRKNYSEADRVLVIFTKDHGKLTLLAKGVRKPKSRKRGHIEIFSHIKFSASVGHTWDFITEVQTLNSFDKVRHDLKKVAVGYYLMDVVNKLTHEEERSEELYLLTLKTFLELETSDKLGSLRKNFITEALTVLGFWPEGKEMSDPDKVLEEVVERKINSVRVAKKLLA